MTALKHLIAGTDLSAPARQAADRAARLAHETGATLTLLHVPPARPLQELQQWLGAPLAEELRDATRRELNEQASALQAARQVQVQAQLGEGAVLDALLQAADAQSAGLLVVGARGAGFLRRWVLGSTAERLLRRTARPVLVVRQAAHEPYRRALLAVDFSPWSAAVVALARQVAPHARWVLFHAFQVPFEDKLRFAGVDAATVDLYRRRARTHADQSLHALAGQAGLKPAQWEPCIVEGEASLRLVEQEQELGCDLVIIGKHGQSAAEDLLLGSTTKHLLAEGVADVLVATRGQP